MRELFKIMKFENDYEFWLYVSKFEKMFAKYSSVKYALGTHSGTAALQLSLIACGIGDRDEVITVPNTYIATALAISNVGARPVFVDIDEETYNIDINKIEEAITDKTKAIIPVHLYGNPAEMKRIMRLAKKYNLKVIEDACQAHGAEYSGKKVGSIGDAGCFSFFTSKNLSCLGNGGMIATDSRKISEMIRILRDPEANSPHLLLSKRTPCYLDAIQVAFLKPKLKYLDKWNELRRRKAKIYSELLSDTDIITPVETKKAKHVYFTYVIRTKRRDKLRRFLHRKGIETWIEYETPIHLTKTFKYLGYKKGDFPVTERVSQEILSLPISPFLKDEEIVKICKTIKNYVK